MQVTEIDCATGEQTTATAPAALLEVEQEERVSVEDRLAAVEARLDRAAAAAVTGEAAKIRDGLKPVT